MFLSPEDCSILQRILRCPVSGRSLVLADERQIAQLNARVLAGELAYFGVEPVEKPLEAAFITDDGALAYPLHQGVALMMPDYAIPLTDAGAQAITDSRIQRYETSVRSFYESLKIVNSTGECRFSALSNLTASSTVKLLTGLLSIAIILSNFCNPLL